MSFGGNITEEYTYLCAGWPRLELLRNACLSWCRRAGAGRAAEASERVSVRQVANLIFPTTQAPAAAPQPCNTRTSWFAEGPHHARGSRQIARSDRPRRKALSACRKISPQKARRPAQRSQRYWADPNSAADVLSSRRRPKAAPDLQAPEQTIDQTTRPGTPRRQSLRPRRISLTYCLPCPRFPNPPRPCH
jgi:hypothetical protein